MSPETAILTGGVDTRVAAVKSQNLGWWCRKFKFKARKSRGVRSTCARRSDFEMQRNAEIELSTPPSSMVSPEL
jgi:hypothetical protein